MEYQINDTLEGKVRRITDFGAFIDLPDNNTGLVHISEISNNYVQDVNDYLSVGQNVKVMVTNIDGDKIDLSIKKANPQEEASEPLVSGIDAKYQVGDIVEGTVTGIAKFGAFVDLPGGVRGLVHISEVSDDYVKNINNYLSIGQKVKVMIIGLEGEKTALSIKQADPDHQLRNVAAGQSQENLDRMISKALKDGNTAGEMSSKWTDRWIH